MRYLISIIFTMALLSNVYTQDPRFFSIEYDYTAHNNTAGSVISENSNIYISGLTINPQDSFKGLYFIYKLDSVGNIIGEVNITDITFQTSSDLNLINNKLWTICGLKNENGEYQNASIKLNKSLNIIEIIPVPSIYSDIFEYDYCDIEPNGNGKYVSFLKSSYTQTTDVLVFLEYNEEGDLIHNLEIEVDEPSNGTVDDFVIDKNGNYVVSMANLSSCATYVIHPDGEVLHEFIPDDYSPMDIAEHPDFGYVTLNRERKTKQDPERWVAWYESVTAYSYAGDTLWTQPLGYTGPFFDSIFREYYEIEVDTFSGDIYVLGETNRFGFLGYYNPHRVQIVKLNREGEIIWNRSLYDPKFIPEDLDENWYHIWYDMIFPDSESILFYGNVEKPDYFWDSTFYTKSNLWLARTGKNLEMGDSQDTLIVLYAEEEDVDNENTLQPLLSFYPNPVTGSSLRIRNEEEQSRDLRLDFYNLQGKQCLSKELQLYDEERLDVSALRNGVYFIRSYDMNRNRFLGTVKVVVRR